MKNTLPRKIILAAALFLLFMNLAGPARAGIKEDKEAAIATMEARQTELKEKVDILETRIGGFNVNDPLKEKLTKKLDTAKEKLDALNKIDPEAEGERLYGARVQLEAAIKAIEDNPALDEITKQNLIQLNQNIYLILTNDPKLRFEMAISNLEGSSDPADQEAAAGMQKIYDLLFPAGKSFVQAEKEAVEAITAVNRLLINPARPGDVPAGDIMTDFIPGIIRQLFRFAWLGVFVALTVSGIYMVVSFDNDERLTKAKHMIYYSLIGFAFVTLAFAIVKAVTNIDFFRFI